MLIAVPKEIKPGETRVAATPDIVQKYKFMGLDVQVQSGAGEASGFSDRDYLNAGAEIKKNAADTYKKADIILKIWAPEAEEDGFLKAGTAVFANFQALTHRGRIETFAHLGLTCFALELMPRISRAQSMDILSSQSNLAGYKAVIEAVDKLSSAVPMMMTAAGTIAPAKALILGAGVAGLQAIATAKRLGAARRLRNRSNPSAADSLKSNPMKILKPPEVMPAKLRPNINRNNRKPSPNNWPKPILPLPPR